MSMLIYVDEVLLEIEETAAVASLLQEKFDADRPATELLLDSRMLKRRVEAISAMLPEDVLPGAAARHIGFIVHFLEKDNIDRCRQDVVDLCETDLPFMAKGIRDWSTKMAYVDVDLRAGLSPLIRTRAFDSAIRKAFVLLKTRLCKKFDLDENLDGPALVSKIFGKDSMHFPNMDAGERQAYQDLFAGLFGLLRNHFAHNDVKPDLAELDAVIANINLCLRIVGDFRTKNDGWLL